MARWVAEGVETVEVPRGGLVERQISLFLTLAAGGGLAERQICSFLSGLFQQLDPPPPLSRFRLQLYE